MPERKKNERTAQPTTFIRRSPKGQSRKKLENVFDLARANRSRGTRSLVHLFEPVFQRTNPSHLFRKCRGPSARQVPVAIPRRANRRGDKNRAHQRPPARGRHRCVAPLSGKRGASGLAILDR